jgi:hypothetical protein
MNELRARTGTLLAASSIVASFLGSRASDQGSGTLTLLALVAFVVPVAACIYVLAPKDNLIFALRGSVLFEAEYDEPGGVPETYRRLAYWLELITTRTTKRFDGCFAPTGRRRLRF